MPDVSEPLVSVIIPVHNDPDRLRICLQALQDQTYPKTQYEVIVIDNGSDHSIEPIVAEFSQAQAAFEACRSSYAARNRGLSLAKGDVVAFTDADCIPDPDWIERGVARLSSEPNIGLIAGNVILFFKDPDNPTGAELYELLKAFTQQKNVEEYQFSVTANLFTFRNVIDAVGQFDSTLQSNGDLEWGRRVSRAGYTLVYAEDVRIAHPARHSLAELRQRAARVYRGQNDLKRKQEYSRVRLTLDVLICLIPPLAVVRALFDARLKGPRQKVKAAATILYVRYIKAWVLLRFWFAHVVRLRLH